MITVRVTSVNQVLVTGIPGIVISLRDWWLLPNAAGNAFFYYGSNFASGTVLAAAKLDGTNPWTSLALFAGNPAPPVFVLPPGESLNFYYDNGAAVFVAGSYANYSEI